MSSPKLPWDLKFRKFRIKFVDAWDKPLSNPFNRFTQFVSILGVLTSVFFAYRTIKLTEKTNELTIKYGENTAQVDKLSDLVRFSQKQEAYKIHLDSINRKVNIIKLRKANRGFQEIEMSNSIELWQFDDEEDHLHKIEIILDREMENPILLDDSSISISWFNLYSELSNTREALNTQLPNFSTTIKENGKDKTYKTIDKLQEFKINSLKRFIKTFHHFTFQFELFMQMKNKEINVPFD